MDEIEDQLNKMNDCTNLNITYQRPLGEPMSPSGKQKNKYRFLQGQVFIVGKTDSLNSEMDDIEEQFNNQNDFTDLKIRGGLDHMPWGKLKRN